MQTFYSTALVPVMLTCNALVFFLYFAKFQVQRSVFLHSSLDGQVPAGANSLILTFLDSQTEAFVYDSAAASHIVANDDLESARSAVAWMIGS